MLVLLHNFYFSMAKMPLLPILSLLLKQIMAVLMSQMLKKLKKTTILAKNKKNLQKSCAWEKT